MDFTEAQMFEALRNAHSAGDEVGARRIAEMIKGKRSSPPQQGMRERVEAQISAGEAGLDPTAIKRAQESTAISQRDISMSNMVDNGMVGDLGPGANFALGLPFVGSYVDDVADFAFPQTDRLPSGGEMLRAAQEQYAESNPKTAIGASLTGAALTLPLAAAQGARIVGQGSNISKISRGLGAGLAGGAIEGGVYGAGLGQGDERLDNAQRGALVGGGVGGALGAAVPLGGMTVRAMNAARANRVGRKSARVLGLSQPAANLIGRNLRADQADIADSIARGGANSTLGGLGPATRSLLDVVANSGGEGGTIAHRNTAANLDAVTKSTRDKINDVLGAPRGPRQVQADIMKSTQESRGAAYEKAFASPIDYSSAAGQRVEDLLKGVDPTHIKLAQRIARAEGAPSRQMRASIDESGDVIYDALPDVREIDYITRAMRDVGGLSGLGPDEARVFKNLSSQLRRAVDDAVPEYKIARAAGGDAISRREGVDFGLKLMRPNVTREDAAIELAGMSKAERDAAVQGVRDYIDEVQASVKKGISSPTSDTKDMLRTLKDMSSEQAKTKIRLLMDTSTLGKNKGIGDPGKIRISGPSAPDTNKAEELLSAIEQANEAFSQRINLGSPTHMRNQNDLALRDELGRNFFDEATGQSPLETAQSLMLEGLRAGGKTTEEAAGELRAEIAGALTTPGAVADRATALIKHSEDDALARFNAIKTEAPAQDALAATAPVGLSMGRVEHDPIPALTRRLHDAGASSAEIAALTEQGQMAMYERIKEIEQDGPLKMGVGG